MVSSSVIFIRMKLLMCEKEKKIGFFSTTLFSVLSYSYFLSAIACTYLSDNTFQPMNTTTCTTMRCAHDLHTFGEKGTLFSSM